MEVGVARAGHVKKRPRYDSTSGLCYLSATHFNGGCHTTLVVGPGCL